jgi:hypothetical protein
MRRFCHCTPVVGNVRYMQDSSLNTLKVSGPTGCQQAVPEGKLEPKFYSLNKYFLQAYAPRIRVGRLLLQEK